jgi:hypothetical protein
LTVLKGILKTLSAPAGAVVGTVADFSKTGHPRVSVAFADGVSLIEARSCVPLCAEDVGRAVVLLFEEQCVDKPIVLGTLIEPNESIAKEVDLTSEAVASPITVDLDGRRAILSAKDEIVLKCGKASITLTHAGKVLIRGAYVSSHSTSVNRIKGGTVEIN